MSNIIDGHVHVTQALLPRLGPCLANADSPEEYAFLRASCVPGMVISAGIHPWKADTTDYAAMAPILGQAAVIGEIGLDGVWCAVDMDIQRRVFRQQLTLAREREVPVVLHTKGMEGEILNTIRAYPNRYLVHWYSCPEHLQGYIDLGCWFTVGPALNDPAVRAVAERAPIDRLLIESDGLEGIAWAQNRPVTPEEYPTAMAEHLAAVAALRGVSPEALAQQMEENFKAFLYE